MTVRQGNYGSAKRPAWTYDDLGPATHAVLTVREVDPEAKIPDDEREEGFRLTLTLTFEEDGGEKTLYTNYTQVGALIERLGADERKWPGQRVVVKKHTATFGKQTYKKVVVAPADEWDAVLGKAAKPAARRAKARR